MAKNKLPKDIKVDLPPAQSARTIAEIQQEYGNLAAKVGQNTYQIYILNREADQLKSKMQDLNFEASALQAKSQPTEGQANG